MCYVMQQKVVLHSQLVFRRLVKQAGRHQNSIKNRLCMIKIALDFSSSCLA